MSDEVEEGVGEVTDALDAAVEAEISDDENIDAGDAEGNEPEAAESDDEGVAEGDDADGEEKEGKEEAEDAPAANDDAVVEVNGEKLTVAELRNGYLRQEDYTRKTTEVAEARRQVAERAERIHQVMERLIGGIEAFIPPMPDENLLQADPQAYLLQKEQHELAVNRLREILDGPVKEANEVASDLSEQEAAEYRQQHLQMLHDWFPETKTPDGFRKFAEEIAETGKNLGFTDDELASVNDARMIRVLKLASEALKMQKARKTAKAKAKPRETAPVKPGRAGGQRSAKLPKVGARVPVADLAKSLPDDMF